MAILSKIKSKINNQAVVTLLVTTTLLVEPAFADTVTAVADPFAATFTKISAWTTGTAGKLITLTAFIMSGISGVAGFRPAIVFGCLGVGIVLASSGSVVNMLFT
jgi:type IV secretory pathway VirB2 component (pilin)